MRRFALPALVIVTAALLALPALRDKPKPEPVASNGAAELPIAPPPRENRPDPARDLKLVARDRSGEPPREDTYSWIELTLVNTSETFTYPVVIPNDGSADARREPYIYYSAEQQVAPDRWELLPPEPHRIADCGLFAFDWQKDVVDLKPGERLVVTNVWIDEPRFTYNHAGGTVRIRGHYDYRRGRRIGRPEMSAERLGRMGDTPPFTLLSNAIAFDPKATP
jgi:hypothetical protein